MIDETQAIVGVHKDFYWNKANFLPFTQRERELLFEICLVDILERNKK